MSDKVAVTVAEILALLRMAAGKNCLAVEELRLGSGYGASEMRRIDLWAINTGPATGCAATAYEVKVARSDYVKDLKNPLKQRGARLFSDQFYYVAPAGLIKADEVPLWAGLIEVYEPPKDSWKGRELNGRRLALRYTVPAPLMGKAAPSWPLVVSLLRRVPLTPDLWRLENDVVEADQ